MTKRSAGRPPATSPSAPTGSAEESAQTGSADEAETSGAQQLPDDGRRSRWVDHRRQRRDELITMAVHAILTHGPDVDMAQIAAVAGVSKPVLYRYFTDKAQLWVAVGERLAQTVSDAVAPAIGQVREERGLIAATIDAYLGTIEAQPELYRFFVHLSGSPAVPHLIANVARTIATDLARVIGDRLRALGLDAGPAEPWAHGMVGMVQAVGDWWILHGRPMSRPALTDYLTTLLWNGLAGVRAAADIPGGLASAPSPSTPGRA
jgi:AcrR family transcriptional regulator